LTRISLAKGKYGIIDLDTPLETSAGRPRPEKIQSSINKCLTDVLSNLLVRDKKADER
jgi:hypothetical protein